MTIKRRIWSEKAFVWGVVLIVAYIPFHAFFSVSIGELSGQRLAARGWKEGLLLALVMLATYILLRDRSLVKSFANSRLNQLIVAFITLHFVTALFLHVDLLATIIGLAIDVRYFVYFLLVRLVLLIEPRARDYLLRAFSIGLVIVIVFGVLQQYVLPRDFLANFGYSKETIQPYLTVDNNDQFVRINSTLRGPNPLGAYIVIGISCVLAWAYSRKRLLSKKTMIGAILLFGGGLSVLYVTQSRSAWLAAVCAFLLVIALLATAKTRRVVFASFIILAFVGGGLLFAMRNTSVVQTLIGHNDPNTGAMVDSNAGHAESLLDGTKRMATQPFGAGIGSTGSASLHTDTPIIIENFYLFVAHEVGWLGLVLFVAIQILVLLKLYRAERTWLTASLFASGVGLVLIGLIQPVFVDDTIAYLWWGLAAVGLGIKTNSPRSTGDYLSQR